MITKKRRFRCQAMFAFAMLLAFLFAPNANAAPSRFSLKSSSASNGSLAAGTTFSALLMIGDGPSSDSVTPSTTNTAPRFQLDGDYVGTIHFGPDTASESLKFQSIYGGRTTPITYTATTKGGMALNLRTGLLDQYFTVENSWITTGRGVVVFVEGLPAGVTLHNRTGETNGMQYIKFAAGMGTGSQIQLLLQFFSLNRATNWTPVLTVVADDGGSTVLGPPSQSFGIRRAVAAAGGGVQLEFDTIPNVGYRVQFKDTVDAVVWTTGSPLISVPDNKASWVDPSPLVLGQGSATFRLYRVIQSQ